MGKEYNENLQKLEFTPLEFETAVDKKEFNEAMRLEFTPLEFETFAVLLY